MLGDEILRKNKIYIAFIVIITIGMISLLPILCKNLKYGLDLQGGFEVLYQIEAIDGTKMNKEKINQTYKILSKRIDSLGVSEPEIIVEGNDKVRIKLAGVKNKDEARRQLSTIATLTFRDTEDNLLMTSDVLTSGGAKISQDAAGNPAVSLSVKDKEKFYDVTNKISKSKDQTIVIWLDYNDSKDSFKKESSRCGSVDSNCLSAATVSQGFASDVIIQGNFTDEEVENLTDLINSGSLPVKMRELSSKMVSASLGSESLEKTATAGIIGVLLIMVLMIVLYRFAGVISSVGIVIYSFLALFFFWLIGGVLTLPGIAAVVIGIGMAIDSSVISFSRIKDELRSGKSLKKAFEDGNKNSFVSILDSNITTLLVAIILFIFGESSVKGFATTLIISILVTLFVMVFVMRKLLKVFIDTGYFSDKTNIFIGKIKKPYQFHFIRNRKKVYIITCILIVIGSLSLIFQGLHLGVDFKGGTSITIQKEITKNDLLKDLSDKGYHMYTYSSNSKGLVDVKVKEVLSQKQMIKLENYIKDKYQASSDIGVVSNIAKRELIKNMIFSLILSFIGIVIYISIRFRFNYAISGLVALFHDVLMMVFFFSVTRLEVSNMFIAALLSIIGYSINDTIVAFDKIRENLRSCKVGSQKDIENVVDLGLNQTIGRSIITSITTMLPVIMMILFGSYEIFNFNIALFIGLISGTYSSIFIASQIWYDLEKKKYMKGSKEYGR